MEAPYIYVVGEEMNSEKIVNLCTEYEEHGLYQGAFRCIDVCIYRHVEFANNMIRIESGIDCLDEVLVVYSIKEEAKRCFFWTDEFDQRYVKQIQVSKISKEEYVNLSKTNFRKNKIAEVIKVDDIESISAFRYPPWDDWTGELFIRTKNKKIVLMWDYSD